MTQQVPDLLHYNGQTFSVGWDIPAGHIQLPADLRAKLPFYTALLRGYHAVFRIEARQLLVEDLLIVSGFRDSELEWSSIVNEVLPGSKQVYWLTGLVALDGYGRSYDEWPPLEKSDVFEFEQGVLVAHHCLDRDEYRLLESRLAAKAEDKKARDGASSDTKH